MPHSCAGGRWSSEASIVIYWHEGEPDNIDRSKSVYVDELESLLCHNQVLSSRAAWQIVRRTLCYTCFLRVSPRKLRNQFLNTLQWSFLITSYLLSQSWQMLIKLYFNPCTRGTLSIEIPCSFPILPFSFSLPVELSTKETVPRSSNWQTKIHSTSYVLSAHYQTSTWLILLAMLYWRSSLLFLIISDSFFLIGILHYQTTLVSMISPYSLRLFLTSHLIPMIPCVVDLSVSS